MGPRCSIAAAATKLARRVSLLLFPFLSTAPPQTWAPGIVYLLASLPSIAPALLIRRAMRDAIECVAAVPDTDVAAPRHVATPQPPPPPPLQLLLSPRRLYRSNSSICLIPQQAPRYPCRTQAARHSPCPEVAQQALQEEALWHPVEGQPLRWCFACQGHRP